MVMGIDLFKPSAYAGIGSRDTPPDVLALMTRIAMKLDAMGWLLRSGGAAKADEAFDHCVTRAGIYLPWARFAERNKDRVHPLPRGPGIRIFHCPTQKAHDIAAMYHPMWSKIKQSEQRLHARNTHEILGQSCNMPCSMVVTWTPDGSIGITTPATRGTGQAIRIAHAYGVPIFNLKRDDHRAEWERFVNEE